MVRIRYCFTGVVSMGGAQDIQTMRCMVKVIQCQIVAFRQTMYHSKPGRYKCPTSGANIAKTIENVTQLDCIRANLRSHIFLK